MLRIEREHTITLDPYEETARGQMGEVVKFFHSRWFGILTDANPDYILEQLKEEN